MVQMTRITKYENLYILVEIYNNVIFVVNFLIAEKVFEKTLGYDSSNNGKSTNTYLFQTRTAMLARGISLQNYIY